MKKRIKRIIVIFLLVLLVLAVGYVSFTCNRLKTINNEEQIENVQIEQGGIDYEEKIQNI